MAKTKVHVNMSGAPQLPQRANESGAGRQGENIFRESCSTSTSKEKEPKMEQLLDYAGLCWRMRRKNKDVVAGGSVAVLKDAGLHLVSFSVDVRTTLALQVNNKKKTQKKTLPAVP